MCVCRWVGRYESRNVGRWGVMCEGKWVGELVGR